MREAIGIDYRYYDGYPCGMCNLCRSCDSCTDPTNEAVQKRLNFLSTLNVVESYNIDDVRFGIQKDA